MKPNNNLILAIFTTLCCCLPLGIYAIIKASKVDNLYNTGQYQAAIAEAAEAKKWSIIGIVIGLIIQIIYFAIYGFAIVQSTMQNM
ncbi:MAG: CD225/dispanin family protein [Prevotella sp.]|nr:CD225/dispanin family protein [Prevotella sp.]